MKQLSATSMPLIYLIFSMPLITAGQFRYCLSAHTGTQAPWGPRFVCVVLRHFPGAWGGAQPREVWAEGCRELIQARVRILTQAFYFMVFSLQ